MEHWFAERGGTNFSDKHHSGHSDITSGVLIDGTDKM